MVLKIIPSLFTFLKATACLVLSGTKQYNTHYITFLYHSHYVILAIPVKRSPSAAHSMPFTPVVPINQVPTKAVSMDMSAKVSDKLPFILGEYSIEDYPHVLKFDGTGMVEKAFKPETHYAFAVMVYGENKVATSNAYSYNNHYTRIQTIPHIA